MATNSILKDNIIYDEKKNQIIGEIYSNEDIVTVSEKLSADNTEYSYVETYKNKNGVIILGASCKLGLDTRKNIMPKYTKMGIWFYDSDFVNNINGINEIIDNIGTNDNPIETLEEFNSDLYYQKHILPDLFTSAFICLKKDYGNNGDNTSYLVEKQLSDGTRTNLSFRYKASADFREQLRNLFHSIIGVNGLSEQYLKECGVCDELKPTEKEIALFDGNCFMKNMKEKLKTLNHSKIDNKQLVK